MYGGHEEKGRTEEEEGEEEGERDLCSLTEWSEAKSRFTSVGLSAGRSSRRRGLPLPPLLPSILGGGGGLFLFFSERETQDGLVRY